MAAGYTPSSGPFDPDKEVIDNYFARLESWFIVNEIDDDKKKHVLVSEVGVTAYAVLHDLAFPNAVTDKTYDEMKALLKSHYKPTNTAMAERLKLHARKQKPDESIQDYIIALKKLAVNCNFGNALDREVDRDAVIFVIAHFSGENKACLRLHISLMEHNITISFGTIVGLYLHNTYVKR